MEFSIFLFTFLSITLKPKSNYSKLYLELDNKLDNGICIDLHTFSFNKGSTHLTCNKLFYFFPWTFFSNSEGGVDYLSLQAGEGIFFSFPGLVTREYPLPKSKSLRYLGNLSLWLLSLSRLTVWKCRKLCTRIQIMIDVPWQSRN